MKIAYFILLMIFIGGWFLLRADRTRITERTYQGESTKVIFTTSDGVSLLGNYYAPSEKPKGALLTANGESRKVREAVLMLHMMPATKESWHALANTLKDRGIASLAIDLRGHGESIKIQNPKVLHHSPKANDKIQILDYRKFNDEEHQASRLDVEAALTWLQKEKGFSLHHIDIIGASIGANLALQAIATYPEIRKCVALSAGLNYRGIEPKTFLPRLQANQEILYVTSQDDQDNTQMTQELYRASPSKKVIKVYKQAGHGTTMLERESDLQSVIINFLSQ